MEHLKITFSDVHQAADTIRSCSMKIYDLLNNASYQMKQLESFWESEGSASIQSHYSQFSSQFEIQREIIDAYANFLDHTVQTYQSLENAINSNASIH